MNGDAWFAERGGQMQRAAVYANYCGSVARGMDQAGQRRVMIEAAPGRTIENQRDSEFLAEADA